MTESIREVALRTLDLLDSIVRFADHSTRPSHAEWPTIKRNAIEVDPVAAAAAARHQRWRERFRTVERQSYRARWAADHVAQREIPTASDDPVVALLERRGLVRRREPVDEGPIIEVIGSFDDLRTVVALFVKRLSKRLELLRDGEAVTRMFADRAADAPLREAIGDWLQSREVELSGLLDRLEPFVERNADRLPGLVSLPDLGDACAPQASACGAVCALATRWLDGDSHRDRIGRQIASVDVRALRVMVEIELAALFRQQPDAERAVPEASFEHAVLRVLDEADGDRLSFAQINGKGQAHDDEAVRRRFPRSKLNRDEEVRIKALVGQRFNGRGVTKVGGGPGHPLSFWME